MAYPPDPIENRGKKPAVRVDNYLLLPDGRIRKLTLKERFQLWRGKKLQIDLSSLKTRVS